MHYQKVLFTILFGAVLARTSDLNLSDTYCDGTGWVAYKDEKCFKLIEKWSTRDEAKDICAQELMNTDSSTPQLISIKSVEEQNALTQFVFDTSGIEVNVWIGAKRQLGNNFAWDDGSEIEFNNWAEGSPTVDTAISCAIMQSRFTRKFSNISRTENRSRINGQWRDVTCKLANYVVCEKLQRWSFGKLQKTLLEQRRELSDTKIELTETKDELAETKNELTETKNDLSKSKNELSETKSESNENKKQLTNIQQNPVPLGFIYVQLPHQPEPKTLWSAVQWKDVTSEFAGMFFRAEGGSAQTFGKVQEDNAPRVTQVRESGPYNGGWGHPTLNVGGWSSGIGVFSGSSSGSNNFYTHQFLTSGGEVRPRNMAMRIWKRIK